MEQRDKNKAASPTSSPSSSSSTASSSSLEKVFNYFDENGDGKISASELQKCVRTIGGELSDEEAEMAVRTSDADGDGLSELEDFEKLMTEGGGEEGRREELRGAFKMYTAEGTAHISPKSLKRMMSKLGKKTSLDDCKAMITKFDLNRDGVLTFDEFKAMMHSPS